MNDDKVGLEAILEEKLPSKHSLPAKLAKCANKMLNYAKVQFRPYYLTVRQPECMAYALGDMVKNLRHMPRDITRYLSTNPKHSEDISQMVKDYKIPEGIVGDALLLSEGVAWAGAYIGADLSGNVVNHSCYAQAICGGLVGSELTTAATLFLTLTAVNSIFYIRHRKKSADQGGLKNNMAKATLRTTAYALPLGLLSFTVVDIGISSLGVYMGLQPETAATVGAIFGTLVYLGSAKASITNSNRSSG